MLCSFKRAALILLPALVAVILAACGADGQKVAAEKPAAETPEMNQVEQETYSSFSSSLQQKE